MNLDALVAPLRSDVVSGATTVARAAADAFRRAAEGADVDGEAEFRDLLSRLAVRILDAQPAMAPLVHLGSRVLTATDGRQRLDALRAAVIEAASEFRDVLERSGAAVARHATELIPSDGRVVTLSFSSTVCSALRKAREAGRRPEVVCLESRPGCEGRQLARRLADGGVSVAYAVDAAAWTFAATSDAVLLGADSVGDAGVVNKIGSRGLAAAAHDAGVPVHVLACGTKLLPPGFPQPTDDDRPGREVWKSGEGIRVWNRYFESTPVRLVETIVVEDGPFGPDRIREMRAELPVPPPLAAWAEGRPPTGRGPAS